MPSLAFDLVLTDRTMQATLQVDARLKFRAVLYILPFSVYSNSDFEQQSFVSSLRQPLL